MSSAGTPAAPPAAAAAGAAVEMSALDDRDAEPRTPMKRLGSTRKLAAFNNIRLQLAEQARVLEARAEAAAGVAGELHDYCRRRADLEHEYSRALDKLARAAAQRHRDQRHKRGEWQLVGAYSCWQTALEQTRALARDHAALADLYGGRLAARTQRAADDVARLHRKCKDIVVERHEEVGGALVEAGAAGKARAAAAAEWRAAAAKLRTVYEQRERVAAAEPARHKKLKVLDKELDKRRQRHSEARARALRARADYILCLEAANATLQRYYLDDVADIMLCMETGFSAVVGRCVQAAGAADEARAAALSAAARALCACARALDPPGDRQRVLDAHPQTFAPPPAQLYQGTPPDEEDAAAAAAMGGAAGEGEDEAAAGVGAELAARLVQLEAGARALRAECRERAKTLDAAERELVLQMEGSDDQWDISGMFGACSVGGGGAGAGASGGGDDPLLSPAPPPTPATPSDAPRKEQEDYYLAKFRSYVCAMGRLARMESRAATLRARLLPALAPARLPPPAPATPTPDDNTHSYRCVRGEWGGGARGQFAAPLEEQSAGAGGGLPRVLTECVRVIATYGLRHQGVFRVSGSQVEMQALRAAFERGADPLCAVRDASDINSVCGLLKMYLRELRPPLLPPALLDRLLRLASLRDESEFVPRMRDLVATLPLCSMLVLRYLFAFLHHLAQYSEDNMMDAWNLAICLGPTLLAARGDGPAAGGGGQVHAQNQVNELVKRVIVHHRDIFPQRVAPHAAYRPETFAPAAEGEGAGQEEQNGDAEGEGDGEGSCSGSECEVDAGSGGRGEHMDDLSLYDDDEEASSDEGDSGSGGWGERGAGGEAEPDRCVGDVERRAAQVSPVPAPAAPCGAVPAPAPAPPPRRLAETTPDLVLDLPARAPAPAPAPAPAAPPADPPTAADTFLHNRDTLKKRPAHNKQASSGSEEEGGAGPGAGAGDGEGSPVPARNTARVAAKFAELTLTGGSLKPALAAKPALLRRPTPHPHHAAPHDH